MPPSVPSPLPVTGADPRPVPPKEPALEDCCATGCVLCVFDVYQMALDNYALALKAWQARHPDSTDPADPAG